jgi:hypothetical protein
VYTASWPNIGIKLIELQLILAVAAPFSSALFLVAQPAPRVTVFR